VTSISHIRSALCAATLGLCLAGGVDAAQESEAPAGESAAQDEQQERIDKLIRDARTKSAFIRPQAVARHARMGEPAGRRLLELSEDEDNERLALFGTDLIEGFGRFPEVPELRARLWPALEDPTFPWRPAAARGLSWDPRTDEAEAFARFTSDPIGPVRTAALDALFRAGNVAREAGEDERAAEIDALFRAAAARQLSDEFGKVRRRAAVLLFSRGHARALWWLHEDLKRVDSYFEMPTGLNARYEAASLLADLGVDLAGYEPELPTYAPEGAPALEDGIPTSNEGALTEIARQIEALVAERQPELPEDHRSLVPAGLPRIARAAKPITDDVVLGLDLRSCRKGDFYLRWTADDVLLVGQGVPARIPLAEGATERLLAVAGETSGSLEGQLFWGQPGCDVEAFRIPRPGTDRSMQLTVATNGLERTEERPAPLTALGAALAASIPEDAALEGEAQRTRDLAQRVRDAFAAIGGPVQAPAPADGRGGDGDSSDGNR